MEKSLLELMHFHSTSQADKKTLRVEKENKSTSNTNCYY